MASLNRCIVVVFYFFLIRGLKLQHKNRRKNLFNWKISYFKLHWIHIGMFRVESERQMNNAFWANCANDFEYECHWNVIPYDSYYLLMQPHFKPPQIVIAVQKHSNFTMCTRLRPNINFNGRKAKEHITMQFIPRLHLFAVAVDAPLMHRCSCVVTKSWRIVHIWLCACVCHR